ncbi:MAG: excinuclease ABC subunit UvrC [Clostridia bacterium]|nr:excinuclease ABC subunit UvrC [Clostridia bacterium]
MNDKIAEKLKLLPDKPGVYKMYNDRGELIYVGKAVNLKNRVRQYFHSSRNHSEKVRAMVANIDDLDFVIVTNETEALNLECNLIKQNKPYYNILLKDDKHFPYIRIDMRQDFPRVEIVRRYKKDGAKYFGPFLSAVALREIITAVRDNFPVRQCKNDIKKMIARGERPCLMYHLGKCCAPCTGKVTRAEYHELVSNVASLFQGNSGAYVKELTEQMQKASEELNFEKAALLRDRIRAVKGVAEKQTASSASERSYDVFALARDELSTLAYGLFVRGGSVVGAESFKIDSGDEPFSEVISQFLVQYYIDSGDIPREIVVKDEPEDAAPIEALLSEQCGHAVRIHTPQRGEKLKQCELARMNAAETLERSRELVHREWERTEGALSELCSVIGIDFLPRRLECFDNSHMQGRDTVGSMVVFIDGKPEKKLYRRFRTKQDVNGDDYLAMREHLTRRYERTLAGDEKFAELPDLLIVDGGRGQLNVALEVLSELGLSHIPAIGLAERNEEIILPDREESVILQRSSPALQLLQRIRDEAHRFAITYHRSLREKSSLYSKLDGIRGIGDARKKALYEKFLTVPAIAEAGIEELRAVNGMDIRSAKSVYAFFHPKENETNMETEKTAENRKIKMLVMDIDDTLVYRSGPVSEENMRAIAKARAAGVYVTLATGRGYFGSSRVVKQLGLDTYVINYGGAMITDAKTEKPLFTTELDNAYVQEILAMADEMGLHAHLYQGDCIVYGKPHHYAEMYVAALDLPHKLEPDIRSIVWKNVPKVLIITEPERVAELLPVFQKHFEGRVAVSGSSPGFIEFNRLGANKGAAVALLAEKLGFRREEVAAIGDNTLDYEMIEYAGLSAVVENGNEKLKAIADVIVPACTENGVAFFIENYILPGKENDGKGE